MISTVVKASMSTEGSVKERDSKCLTFVSYLKWS